MVKVRIDSRKTLEKFLSSLPQKLEKNIKGIGCDKEGWYILVEKEEEEKFLEILNREG